MRLIAFYILVMLVSSFVPANKQGRAPKHNFSLRADRDSSQQKLLGDSVVKYAHTFLGNHYKYGSTGRGGFDCSGYTCHVFKKFGIILPHASYLMANKGTAVKLTEARKGDLIFFKGSDARSKQIGHVGIVVSNPNEPLRFIHASIAKGVVIDYLAAPYYKARYVKVKRIL